MNSYNTRIASVSVGDIQDDKNIKEAVELLKAGELVAIPTETVYGLAADSTNPEAVQKIYKVKNRPSDNPLIEHVCDIEMAYRFYGNIPQMYLELLSKYWPGPLTVILRIPDKGTVGVRCPANPIAREIIRRVGKPLSAPSANLSTKVSPTRAAYVMNDLDGLISLIIQDADEECSVGLESTVVDALTIHGTPLILRPGGLSLEDLRKVPGYENAEYFDASRHSLIDTNKPATPGMKYKHYAPSASVRLYSDFNELSLNDSGRCIGLIRLTQLNESFLESEIREHCKDGSKHVIYDIQSDKDNVIYAKHLFRALRYLDEVGCDFIYAPIVSSRGLGAAVMDRLKKSAQ
ncbi:hypothetical protein MIR68_007471 [Amoeboaphelidium protococcarum]|nr:hypothetical protein MIR68_007471 [Amoeboaphelidium protococcarum]